MKFEYAKLVRDVLIIRSVIGSVANMALFTTMIIRTNALQNYQ